MVDIGDALASAAKNAYCTLSGPTATGLSILGSVYNGIAQTGQGDDLIASANLLRNASNKVCNRPPENASGSLSGGFSGGQCDNHQYLVTQDRLSPNYPGTGCVSPATGIQWVVWGPISQRRYTDDNGLLVIETLARPGVGQPIQIISQLSGAFNVEDCPGQDLVITSVVNQTDPADPCGDFPGDIPPYNPDDWTTSDTVNYDDENNNPVSIDVDFSFDPAVRSPGGGISIPVTLDFDGDLQLFGDIDLTTGDITIGFGNEGGSGITNNPVELDENQDPEQLGLVVVAMRVISVVDLDATEATEIGQSGSNPDIFAPRLGHVAFRYPLPSGGSAWGEDIPVKNTDQIIWSDGPAVGIGGTPNVGASFTLKPIVVAACQDSC